MKKIILGTAIIAALFLTLGGCNKNTTGTALAQGAGDAAPAETVYAVNTATVHSGSLDAYLEFGGDVAAASSVDVMPEASGRLHRLAVKVGDFVERNQLIGEVDPSHPGLNYALSPVRTPIAGTVVSLPFAVGSTVAPGISIARISTANNLEITIEVAERFVSRVRLAQRASLVFDAYPGETFDARVVEISPVINATSRTETVTLTISPQGKIKIGMYARVKLITDEHKNVLVIPYDSITMRNDQAFVYVRDRVANTAKLVGISPGIRVDDMLEVRSGLLDGDEIVVKVRHCLMTAAR